MTDFHREELHKMAMELSKEKAGSSKYISCYRKALKLVEERLDDLTRVRYRAEARKWTEDMPPCRQQQRYAHTSHICDVNKRD